MSKNQCRDTHSGPGQSKLDEDLDNFFAELQTSEFGMGPTSPKRPRRTYDEKELEKLEAVFVANSYPDRAYRNALATEMCVSPKNIQIWFQNRRARERLLRRKAEGVVENPIDRMRVQLAQTPQYSAVNCENQKQEALGQLYPSHTLESEERHPLRSITNIQRAAQVTGHHQSQIENIQLPQLSPIPHGSMDECSNSETPLPHIWQQDTQPCGYLSALPTGVLARVSVSSISNLSEISNSSFSELVAAMDSLEDHLSPNYDLVFDF